MDEISPNDAMLAENESVASEENSPDAESGATDSGPPAEEKSSPREDEKRSGRWSKAKATQEATILEDIARRFRVCGRCSTFFAECRAKLDAKLLDNALQQLQADREKEWLVLPWQPDVRLIVFKLYATPDDHEYDYFDGHCPECGRRLIYHVHPIQETAPSFRLHL
jgi:hypothetical protein